MSKVALSYFLQCLANFEANLTSLIEKIQKKVHRTVFMFLGVQLLKRFASKQLKAVNNSLG